MRKELCLTMMSVYLLLSFIHCPLGAQDALKPGEEVKFEIEELIVNQDAFNEEDELLPDLWNLWSGDEKPDAWSGGTVLRSPVVDMDRDEDDDGAPILHVSVPIRQAGVYTVIVQGPHRPVGVSMDEGKTWRCMTKNLLLKETILQEGHLDIWFDDRYAAKPPLTLGSTYLDYIRLIYHGPAEWNVYNGDFEDLTRNEKGWIRGWYWFQRKKEGEMTIVDGGHEGKCSLLVKTPSGNGRDWAVESTCRLPVLPGTTIEMSAWVKRLKGGRNFRLEMVSYAKGERTSWKMTSSRRPPMHSRRGEWVRISGYATIGEDVEEISVRLVGHQGVELQLDDVRVTNVSTSQPDLAEDIKLHVHVPKGYDPKQPRKWRALVIFGGRNNLPRTEVTNRLGWAEWSDQNDIFLIAPDFDDNDYWQPQLWSGAALEMALARLEQKYPIATDKLLYYGYSEGSQASCQFAAWRPERCRAWVAHACGVFWQPNDAMKDIPQGLVTCGDADAQRYVLGRDFARACLKAGIPLLWKTIPNSAHEVTEASLKLARAFLTHWHNHYLDDLGLSPLSKPHETFIGNDATELFYPTNDPQIKNIPEEDRIPLPSKDIAQAWGKSAH